MRRSWMGIVLVTAGFVTAVQAQDQTRPSRSYQRGHPLHSLDARVAETLAWEICREIGFTEEDPCKVIEATVGNLYVLGTDEVHAAIVKMLVERDPAVRSAQHFEVTLVRTVKPPEGSRPADFPEHVGRALEGVLELMPDLRFEAIATGWVRTSDQGKIRLADDDGNRYVVRIHYRGSRVGLERTELILGISAIRDSNNPNLRDLLETSLSIYIDETVVVGSSSGRLPDDPVIFLLLTVLK